MKEDCNCPEMKISMIKEGTALDHIPSKATFKVMSLLKLRESEEIVSIAYNLSSEKLGKKGIIKIGGKSLSKKEIAKIALVAPECTMNVIKDFKVKEKVQITIPNKLEGVGHCINPNCITNVENSTRRFTVVSKDPVKIRCDFCEKMMTKDTIIVK